LAANDMINSAKCIKISRNSSDVVKVSPRHFRSRASSQA